MYLLYFEVKLIENGFKINSKPFKSIKQFLPLNMIKIKYIYTH